MTLTKTRALHTITQHKYSTGQNDTSTYHVSTRADNHYTTNPTRITITTLHTHTFGCRFGGRLGVQVHPNLNSDHSPVKKSFHTTHALHALALCTRSNRLMAALQVGPTGAVSMTHS